MKKIIENIKKIDAFCNKYFLYSGFIAIVWILIFIVFSGSFSSDHLYRNYKNDLIYEVQVVSNSEYNIAFEAQSKNLRQIRLSLDPDSRLKSSDKMHVKLTDSEGYVLSEVDTYIYNANRNYIPVNFSKIKLTEGERYYLFFTFDEMDSNSVLILNSHIVKGFSDAMEYVLDYDSNHLDDSTDDFEIVSDELSFDISIGYTRVANITYVYSKTNILSFFIHLILLILAICPLFISKWMSEERFKKNYCAISVIFVLYIVGELLNVENSRPLNVLMPFSLKHWFCLIVSALVIFIIYNIFYYVIGNNVFSGCITSILFLVIAFVNHSKLVMRGDSFMPWDLVSAGIAVKTGSTYYFHVTKEFVFSIFLIVTLLVLFRLTYTKFEKLSKERGFGILVSVFVLAITMLGTVLNTGLLDYLKIYYAVYPPIQSYNENGTYMAFLMHLNNINARGGNNNSADATEEVLYRYEGVVSSMDLNSRVNNGNIRPNVICIMSEAYTDLQRIRDFETSEPVMPYFESLKDESLYGDLAVSIFGGGTCNTEFEFLTGYSMSSLLPGASVYSFYVNNEIEALPNIYAANGYRTVALHSFDGDWWERRQKYPYLGFDEFYTRDDFSEDTEYVRRYISDRATFEKITDIYESSEEPLFLFCVTMQNHADFSSRYDNMHYDIKITDLLSDDGNEYTYAENYISLIRESDEALSYLIEYLRSSDEPTIVVFFGDHCPSLEAGFYDSLLQCDMGTVGIEQSLQIYQTPYMIWANYDLNNGTSIDVSPRDAGITSPNFLGQTILDLSGIHSPMSRSVLRVLQQNIGAISSVAIYDNDGNAYCDMNSVDEEVNSIISDYSFVQYGLVYYPVEEETA